MMVWENVWWFIVVFVSVWLVDFSVGIPLL